MGESRRHYDEEFKRNAVELSYRNGKTVGPGGRRPGNQQKRALQVAARVCELWRSGLSRAGKEEARH
jgi:transposase-like protein